MTIPLRPAPQPFEFEVRIVDEDYKQGVFRKTIEAKDRIDAWPQLIKKLREMKVLNFVVKIEHV